MEAEKDVRRSPFSLQVIVVVEKKVCATAVMENNRANNKTVVFLFIFIVKCKGTKNAENAVVFNAIFAIKHFVN